MLKIIETSNPVQPLNIKKERFKNHELFLFPVLQFFSATKQKRRKKVPGKRHEVATFLTGSLRRMGLRRASIFFCFGGVLATISFFPRENNSEMVGLKYLYLSLLLPPLSPSKTLNTTFITLSL